MNLHVGEEPPILRQRIERGLDIAAQLSGRFIAGVYRLIDGECFLYMCKGGFEMGPRIGAGVVFGPLGVESVDVYGAFVPGKSELYLAAAGLYVLLWVRG
ncbi:hypothetical protein RXV86_16095 [Alisedimentitalea sp. MJ-SS2]|uniref:hypothetical protein n=1 Tax=Aliisedimentitalea sp. MJ-SS2 TaxID=3049795 RepID=UPI00290E7F46|nr:hypothetical protein [Alisedimentitalea sp. MJ-SS2]MDU8928915.1 hypothetical protein [Alisedimentitalea sp. MJ-SS2]